MLPAYRSDRLYVSRDVALAHINCSVNGCACFGGFVACTSKRPKMTTYSHWHTRLQVHFVWPQIRNGKQRDYVYNRTQ